MLSIERAKRFQTIAYAILVTSSLYVAATSGWILTENRNIITVMEVLTIAAALLILWFMTELFASCGEKQKTQGLLALVFTAFMAVVTILNHFMYITVLGQMYRGTAMPSWLLLDGWPSISKGLECVSWGLFLGLAMVFASGVLEAWRNLAISWTMRISGILTLAGLIGPVVGDMRYYMLSTIGYSVGFLILSIEMLMYFRKYPMKGGI